MGGGGFLGFGSTDRDFDQRPTSRPIFPGGLEQASGIVDDIRTGAANLSSVPTEEDLFHTQSRRLLQAIRPGLAARGFEDSGPAQDIENQALTELGQQFGSRAFERGITREQLSLENLSRLLATILGQQTLGETPVETRTQTFQLGGDIAAGNQ